MVPQTKGYIGNHVVINAIIAMAIVIVIELTEGIVDAITDTRMARSTACSGSFRMRHDTRHPVSTLLRQTKVSLRHLQSGHMIKQFPVDTVPFTSRLMCRHVSRVRVGEFVQ